MSDAERRLSGLLKQAVPTPPRELSAEEIMVTTHDRSRKSWTLPALSAGAILVVGVTVGVVATHHAAPPKTTFSPAAHQSSASSSPTPSGTPTPSATATATTSAAARVAVPNVVGQTELQATRVLQQAGFDVRVLETPAGAGHEQPGTVWSQNPPAGAALPTRSTVTIDVQPAS